MLLLLSGYTVLKIKYNTLPAYVGPKGRYEQMGRRWISINTYVEVFDIRLYLFGKTKISDKRSEWRVYSRVW